MIRRMTYVCSVAMAAVVAIWLFGAGASVLSAQETDSNRVIMSGGATVRHAGYDEALARYFMNFEAYTWYKPDRPAWDQACDYCPAATAAMPLMSEADEDDICAALRLEDYHIYNGFIFNDYQVGTQIGIIEPNQGVVALTIKEPTDDLQEIADPDNRQ